LVWGRPLTFYLCVLEVSKMSREQSRTRNKISWKPADPGWRRMSPAPKRDEWGAGDVGAATAAMHIKFQRLNSQNRFEQRSIAATRTTDYTETS
jgi:hypothetical protein